MRFWAKHWSILTDSSSPPKVEQLPVGLCYWPLYNAGTLELWVDPHPPEVCAGSDPSHEVPRLNFGHWPDLSISTPGTGIDPPISCSASSLQKAPISLVLHKSSGLDGSLI